MIKYNTMKKYSKLNNRLLNYSVFCILYSIFCIFLISCSSKVIEPVIATVGKSKITLAYFQKKLEDISPDFQDYLNSSVGKKQFLDVLVNEKLILLAAKESAVANSKEYSALVKKMEDELKIKMDEYKEYLLTKMWIEHLKKDTLTVSNEEIQKYYQEHPYEVSIEHAVLGTYEEAESILKKVKSGMSFSKISQTNPHGFGKLPPIMYGEFVPEIEDMIFKMRTGEIQGGVKSKLGYHVVKKVSQNKTNFPEVKERIGKIIEKKKFDKYLDTLQSRYKVEVLNDEYK
jgi:parvulin-like peptidyl-prolyl isomerase